MSRAPSGAVSGSYAFGPFRLDLERRMFTRDAQVLSLAPKTFDLLALLVRNPGRALSKRELMGALWPDTFVEEANLSFQISLLRKALGDDGARWIETVPKHGYRFTAAVRADRDEARSIPPVGTDPSPAIRPGGAAMTRWVAGGLGVATLLVVLTYAAGSWRAPSAPVARASALAAPLTAYPGVEHAPSLSPDASQVAFAWNGPAQDNVDIYVKLVGPGEPLRLTTHPAWDDMPAWSPDGRRIAFLRSASGESEGTLVIMPALGGAERTIATVFLNSLGFKPYSNLAWTPDGRWLAVGGALSAGGPEGIWLVSADRTETRRLTDARLGGRGDTGPVPSPDGRSIAFLRDYSMNRTAVFVLPLTSDGTANGTPVQLTFDSQGIDSLAWMPDGRNLVFSSGGHLGISRLATVPATPGSPPRPRQPEVLPFGEQATTVTVSSSGRLVYSAEFRDTTLYAVPLTEPLKRPHALAAFSSTYDEHTPHFSPDGARLAFASTRSGTEEIWVANADGSHPLQMTSMGGPQCANPQWSPDGRTILFNSRREGSADLYLLQPDTGALHRLTTGPSEEGEARWSRDGRSIYFGSNQSGTFQVWRMPAAGGPATQITRLGGLAATEARDGFLYYSKDVGRPSSIWRMPVAGGDEEKVADGLSYSLNYAVGNRGLYFVSMVEAPDKGALEFVDLRTRTRTTLARLDKPFWWGMTLSPDERFVIFPMVDSAGSNLMVVDNVR